MGAGLYSGEETGDPAGVPCDPEQWSEDSQRSVSYGFATRPYRDKAYLCWRCNTQDVFTAAEQKHTFEVRKAYIWQQRFLCQECYKVRVELEREARACRQRWASEMRELSQDPVFLNRWLKVLESLPEYAGKRDDGNITMLRRLVVEFSLTDEKDETAAGSE